MHDAIIIKGARLHNLKNIDLAIPKNKLVVFTGLSGSGKSSLALDTLYDLIRAADWLIDLGPEGGAAGGRLVAKGTPDQVAAAAESHTGRCLRGG